MPPRPVSWSHGRNFGIVIDAGSSGSRVQVYSWLEPSLALSLRRNERKSIDVLSKVEKGVESGEGWHFKVEPGISTFGEDQDGLPGYLKPLLDFASSVIPPSQHSCTPIYLLATAGMRLLSPLEQSSVLETACTIMQTYDFLLPDCTSQVRVITGEEEGLYGWIAVNYLLDGFDSHGIAHTHDDDASSSTYGFLDMGGASTQIAFEPVPTEREKHADNLVEVRLRLLSGKDVRHPVFVTTWLGFGTNQARERYHSHLIDLHPSSTSIPDPCLPTDLMLSSPRHPEITFKGTGEFLRCVQNTSPLLDKTAPCPDEPCLFAGVHAPALDFAVNRFVGVSEYWYSTLDLWASPAPGGMYDFVAFERAAVEFCKRDWEGIMKDHRDGQGRGGWRKGVDLARLETQCFKAAWVINVLHEGIGIPRLRLDEGGSGEPGRNATQEVVEKAEEKGFLPEAVKKGRPPHFQSMDKIGDVAISWTLGKMVLEVSRSAPPEKEDMGKWHWNRPSEWAGRIPRWNSSSTNSHLPIGGILVLIVILVCVFGSKRRRKAIFGTGRKKKDYGPIPRDEEGGASGSEASTTSNGDSPKRRAGPTRSLRRALRAISSRLRVWGSGSNALSRSNSLGSPRGRETLLPMQMKTSSNVLGASNIPRSIIPPPPPLNASNLKVEGEDMPRPRPVRSVKSTPFLRGAPSSTAANGWNDAPDLGIGSFPRSITNSTVPTSSSAPSVPDVFAGQGDLGGGGGMETPRARSPTQSRPNTPGISSALGVGGNGASQGGITKLLRANTNGEIEMRASRSTGHLPGLR